MKTYIVRSWSDAHKKERVTRIVNCKSESEAKLVMHIRYPFDKIIYIDESKISQKNYWSDG